MKLLSFLIPFLVNLLNLLGKKITISQQAAQFLKDLKSIADNADAIADGTYTFTSTGNTQFDGVEQIVIGFIKDYQATNPDLVTTEMKNLLDEVTPIINTFIEQTQDTTEAPAEASVGKPSFLESALIFIEDILGIKNKSGSPEVVTAQVAAQCAKAQIQKHIEANAAPAAKSAN